MNVCLNYIPNELKFIVVIVLLSGSFDFKTIFEPPLKIF